jgi:hypothetical protein
MKSSTKLESNRVIQKICLKEETEANFLKTKITTLQGAKRSFVVVLKQV